MYFAYISILKATYYLVTLLPHYMFRLYTAISGVPYLAKIIDSTLCQNFVSRVNAIYPD
jgi:hypothetical protein